MSKSVHFSESEFPKEFPVITKKPYQTQINIKCSTYEKKKKKTENSLFDTLVLVA